MQIKQVINELCQLKYLRRIFKSGKLKLLPDYILLINTNDICQRIHRNLRNRKLRP